MESLSDRVSSPLNDSGTCAKSGTRLTQRGSQDVLRQQWLDAPEHVYFIYSAGRVKIGYSTDWFKRMETICVACPHPAELILVMPGNRKDERNFHLLFSDYRETGEWFRLDGDLRRVSGPVRFPGGPGDVGACP